MESTTQTITVRGYRVREVLRELNMTQEELAKKLGMKRETLNRKINGQANWTFSDLDGLTRITGKDINYFIDL